MRTIRITDDFSKRSRNKRNSIDLINYLNEFVLLFFLYLHDTANVHNYADNSTLSSFSNTIPNLINILKQETNTAISCLTNNNVIANPEKFHCIILTKNKADNS